MGVMDFFRAGAPAPVAQPAPVQAANGQAQTPANPSLQGPAATPDLNAASVQETKDPMEAFKDLWAPAPVVEGQEPEFNPSAIFNLDPASMAKSIGTINFAEAVTQEQLQAITAGGEEGMKAFMAAMNSVSSKTMTLATTASAKMIERAMTSATGAMDKKINNTVRSNQAATQLKELNPALSNPAVAPMINAMKTQLEQKYPMAGPAEIAKMANEYVSSMITTLSPKQAESGAEDNTPDWNAYMGGS